ncbi:hypothetical protein MJO28_015665 [Puccinia striiformis f. sp. tritici]|uniref:Exoribonuclease phosphorolytic domain-containing protein n=4 Tax=Puccinia striiformis TaxID=27350 RepID=A0A0L0VNS1_9BASI|nr:uncharacterized protein Pst134EA_032335 [Puccinia striiformis f. sp. tritici]KAI9614299.1 hypothetical protein H4Q26_009442 [Puccinia striiformis f. sp. tritici PST-130]KNF00906.1 hypothetical protein PSTG_05799 [Puccinia striiformis f. sp. tritici PST-78]POW09066.1 hypothetical protein PSHT_09280 [Puccinia striiformis]KAH9441336.1 hypothetical protein Pst134EB_029997 [Puccinia striiformis f. sp. tritici]KAH9444320.1 hypothetical protein Pst134EA_032335 [Puccinia striiformis f. sp. tritici]
MSIIRSDSRTEVDVRSLTMRMSILSRSDGSGQFSFGDLKALGAVTGPAEVRIRDEKPTEASIEVNVVPVCGLPGPQTKSLAHSIKQFFAPLILVKKYPRSLIQINLQTLSKPSDRWTNGFSTSSLEDVPVRLFDETQSVTEKAALINAASLALLDAGVGMRGCGFAVGVAIIPASVTKSNNNLDNDNSDHIVLDPNPTEESSAKSLHLIGLHFGHQFNTPSSDGLNVGHVTLCESNGNFSFDQLQTVLKYGSLATQQILEFVRRSCETVYQQHEPDQEENSNPSDPNSSAVNATNENRKKKKVKKTK